MRRLLGVTENDEELRKPDDLSADLGMDASDLDDLFT